MESVKCKVSPPSGTVVMPVAPDTAVEVAPFSAAFSSSLVALIINESTRLISVGEAPS